MPIRALDLPGPSRRIRVEPTAIAVGGVLPEDLRNFLTSEFGLVVEDASELADSFGTLETVTGEIVSQRSNWSDEAQIGTFRLRFDPKIPPYYETLFTRTIWIVSALAEICEARSPPRYRPLSA